MHNRLSDRARAGAWDNGARMAEVAVRAPEATMRDTVLLPLVRTAIREDGRRFRLVHLATAAIPSIRRADACVAFERGDEQVLEHDGHALAFCGEGGIGALRARYERRARHAAGGAVRGRFLPAAGIADSGMTGVAAEVAAIEREHVIVGSEVHRVRRDIVPHLRVGNARNGGVTPVDGDAPGTRALPREAMASWPWNAFPANRAGQAVANAEAVAAGLGTVSNPAHVTGREPWRVVDPDAADRMAARYGAGVPGASVDVVLALVGPQAGDLPAGCLAAYGALREGVTDGRGQREALAALGGELAADGALDDVRPHARTTLRRAGVSLAVRFGCRGM